MYAARDLYLDILSSNRKGSGKGIYSVCSANPVVLEACFRQALDDRSMILIESTSNQVDQFGGYTGMKPADFTDFVHGIAGRTGFPREKILLGGDHLGPNTWQNRPAEEAMENASVLIREYVKAGYQKIHLDTSMFCADDKGDRTKPLNDETVAARAATLCRVAEDTFNEFRCSDAPPVYIIGTEVPVPGGASNQEEQIVPTHPEDALKTIEITKKHFYGNNLREAWGRVTGLVVQPGVEYGDNTVFHYNRTAAKELSDVLSGFDNLVYEAHSTDYQTEKGLKAMVEDHFCILKVGPWLTFAYREALFALEAMEIEIMGKDHPQRSRLTDVLEASMVESPGHWQKYYTGDENQKAFKRKYSFSDRSRYYWPMKAPEKARKKLFENLETRTIPLSLLSQFMPARFYQAMEGKLEVSPSSLVQSHIRTVAGIYARACGLS